MKKLSKDEMKRIMGGVKETYIVSCDFEPGYSGSYGSCTGSKEGCQQAANNWCNQAANHCVSCTVA